MKPAAAVALFTAGAVVAVGAVLAVGTTQTAGTPTITAAGPSTTEYRPSTTTVAPTTTAETSSRAFTDDVEAWFVEDVRTESADRPLNIADVMDDADLIEFGWLICAGIDVSPVDAVVGTILAGLNDGGGTALGTDDYEMAGHMIAAAVSWLCPEHGPKLDAWLLDDGTGA